MLADQAELLDEALARASRGLLPYASEYLPTIRQHLAELLSDIQSLTLRVDSYTHPDGTTADLLVAEGTLPMWYRGVQYHLPIAAWLPESYPLGPPILYVVPTPSMVVRPRHPTVAASGLVNTAYLRSWEFPDSTLREAVIDAAISFGQDPPLFSKPPGWDDDQGQGKAAGKQGKQAGKASAAAGQPPQASWGAPSKASAAAGQPPQASWGAPSKASAAAGQPPQASWGAPSKASATAGQPPQASWGAAGNGPEKAQTPPTYAQANNPLRAAAYAGNAAGNATELHQNALHLAGPGGAAASRPDAAGGAGPSGAAEQRPAFESSNALYQYQLQQERREREKQHDVYAKRQQQQLQQQTQQQPSSSRYPSPQYASQNYASSHPYPLSQGAYSSSSSSQQQQHQPQTSYFSPLQQQAQHQPQTSYPSPLQQQAQHQPQTSYPSPLQQQAQQLASTHPYGSASSSGASLPSYLQPVPGGSQGFEGAASYLSPASSAGQPSRPHQPSGYGLDATNPLSALGGAGRRRPGASAGGAYPAAQHGAGPGQGDAYAAAPVTGGYGSPAMPATGQAGPSSASSTGYGQAASKPSGLSYAWPAQAQAAGQASHAAASGGASGAFANPLVAGASGQAAAPQASRPSASGGPSGAPPQAQAQQPPSYLQPYGAQPSSGSLDQAFADLRLQEAQGRVGGSYSQPQTQRPGAPCAQQPSYAQQQPQQPSCPQQQPGQASYGAYAQTPYGGYPAGSQPPTLQAPSPGSTSGVAVASPPQYAAPSHASSPAGSVASSASHAAAGSHGGYGAAAAPSPLSHQQQQPPPPPSAVPEPSAGLSQGSRPTSAASPPQVQHAGPYGGAALGGQPAGASYGGAALGGQPTGAPYGAAALAGQAAAGASGVPARPASGSGAQASPAPPGYLQGLLDRLPTPPSGAPGFALDPPELAVPAVDVGGGMLARPPPLQLHQLQSQPPAAPGSVGSGSGYAYAQPSGPSIVSASQLPAPPTYRPPSQRYSAAPAQQPFASAQASASSPPPPPPPPPPPRAPSAQAVEVAKSLDGALRAAAIGELSWRLRRSLAGPLAAARAQVDACLMTRGELLSRADVARSETRALRAAREAVDRDAAAYAAAADELEAWLARAGSRAAAPPATPDEAIEVPDPDDRAALLAHARDAALEDAMAALDRFLADGNVSAALYLRLTRQLSRQQLRARVLGEVAEERRAASRAAGAFGSAGGRGGGSAAAPAQAAYAAAPYGGQPASSGYPPSQASLGSSEKRSGQSLSRSAAVRSGGGASAAPSRPRPAASPFGDDAEGPGTGTGSARPAAPPKSGNPFGDDGGDGDALGAGFGSPFGADARGPGSATSPTRKGARGSSRSGGAHETYPSVVLPPRGSGGPLAEAARRNSTSRAGDASLSWIRDDGEGGKKEPSGEMSTNPLVKDL